MAWINPPEPSDDTVIWEATDDTPAFTWGDHKRMAATLAEIESEDPALAAASDRLNEGLEKLGISPFDKVIRICEYCGVQEHTIHKYNCPEAANDVTGREAGAYQYLNDRFEVVLVTSVPRTDEFALRHFKNVQMMNEDENICYITRRAMHESEYKMMPFRFDRTLGEEGEVVPIERSGS